MKLTRIVGWTLVLTVLALGATPIAHERKEVAGLEVVFGAEPEPAINGDKQFLRWRFLKDKQPFADVEALTATVKRNGKSYGPFTGRTTPREPGVVSTQHIFTNAGEYEATLTFRKKGEPTVHTITFAFKIGDRKQLEIPSSPESIGRRSNPAPSNAGDRLTAGSLRCANVRHQDPERRGRE